jgi:hypothetical protein
MNKIKNNTERNQTIKMMKILRSLIKEEEIKDEVILDSNQLKEEQKKFNDTVTFRNKIDVIKIYPKDGNVIMFGNIYDGDDFDFEMSLKGGVFLSTDTIELNKEVVDIINKIYNYYEVWAEEWTSRLTDKNY